MAIRLIVRKWGNSLAAVIPKDIVEENRLRPNQEVLVELVKEADLRPIFGSLKRTMSGQKFKDLAREGWE